MSHRRGGTMLCRVSMGSVAIGLAAAALSSAAHPQASSGARVERAADHRLKMGDGPAVSIAVPIGKAWVGSGPVEGEPRYARRTKLKGGMTIVEVTVAPDVPVLASTQFSPGVGASAIDPNTQPAGW